MFGDGGVVLAMDCRAIAALASAALASLFLLAGPASAADAWAENRKLLYLYPTADGYIFRFDGAQVNIGSPCESNRMIIHLTHPNYDSLLATLISAFAANWPVDVSYDDSTITACNTTATRFVAFR